MTLYDYFQEIPSVFYLVVFLISLMVGSFLNVVIYRLPVILKREWKSDCLEFLGDQNVEVGQQAAEEKPFNLAVPRSQCPDCGHRISALENIPVLSWIMLKGKCSACNSRISVRYPVVELLTALLSVLTAYTFGAQWFTLAALVLLWSLMALTFIDYDTQLLPDNITLPVLWLGIFVSLFDFAMVDLRSSVIGAIAGYLSLWMVYQLFKLATGKEGMGHGDFKLLSMLGAWLGWQALPLIIILSACVGALVGITLIAFTGRDKNIPIPFGPYLAAAGFISLIWGQQITSGYLEIIGF